MSEYEKGYADGFNARKVISVVKMQAKNGDVMIHCGNCGKMLGKYKPKTYKFCPYCGVKLREQG